MENFDLQIATIDGDTRRFRVAVRSPAGEARPEEVVLPPWPKDPGDLDALAAERLGAALWDAAFPPSFRLRWERSLGTTGGELRLRICTEEGDVATTSVPWELLYDADGAGFLALHSGTPVVRYLEGPDDGAQPYRPGTLRLLLSGASPTGMESLLVSAQHNALADVLQRGTGKPAWVVTRDDHLVGQSLVAHLIRQNPHIFHFTGHGVWDGASGTGLLVLEDGSNGWSALPSATLASALSNRNVLLAVLMACHGGVAGSTRWAGVAQALVRAGVPAVVAMAAPISAPAAATFGQIFYTALAANDLLESAMTAGRQALKMGGQDIAATDWAVPLLFTRMHDGHLWAEQAADESQSTVSSDNMSSIRYVDAGTFVNASQGPVTVNNTFVIGQGKPSSDHATDEAPLLPTPPTTEDSLRTADHQNEIANGTQADLTILGFRPGETTVHEILGALGGQSHYELQPKEYIDSTLNHCILTYATQNIVFQINGVLRPARSSIVDAITVCVPFAGSLPCSLTWGMHEPVAVAICASRFIDVTEEDNWTRSFLVSESTNGQLIMRLWFQPNGLYKLRLIIKLPHKRHPRLQLGRQ